MAFMASGGYKGIGAQVPNVKVRSATPGCWCVLWTFCICIRLAWRAPGAWQGRAAAVSDALFTRRLCSRGSHLHTWQLLMWMQQLLSTPKAAAGEHSGLPTLLQTAAEAQIAAPELQHTVFTSDYFLQPPVLVLWGRQDRILPPATAQQFAEALPAATVTYLENSGHSGHLEEPEETAAAILDFVGGCSAARQ